ncbi:unnamed protein product [Darwinula stevensoni]|uniref:Uncharacterized protein n=1 Tax=Darwinula stevensoni TaxID=69355 RepID=A0A7R8XD47_9CRUS|nr:unnamed protein product [Darwinula stevensoni]CAG0893961.1 unnamed protein product [Darwinula stevensoni]
METKAPIKRTCPTAKSSSRALNKRNESGHMKGSKRLPRSGRNQASLQYKAKKGGVLKSGQSHSGEVQKETPFSSHPKRDHGRMLDAKLKTEPRTGESNELKNSHFMKQPKQSAVAVRNACSRKRSAPSRVRKSATCQDEKGERMSEKEKLKEEKVQDMKPPPSHLVMIQVNVRNVSATATLTPCRLDLLHHAALSIPNVIFKREYLSISLRNPRVCINVFQNGKMVVVGGDSEEECRVAFLKVICKIKKLGYHVEMKYFKITNVMATCRLPFICKNHEVVASFPKNASYEPEISPGLNVRDEELHVSFVIHATGSVIIIAQNESNISVAVKKWYHRLKKCATPTL